MKEMTVRISKEGDLTFLYKDGHPGLKIGKNDIERASDVRYDNKKKKWKIYLQGESFNKNFKETGIIFNSNELIIGHSHKKREDAIREEVSILNKFLGVFKLI